MSFTITENCEQELLNIIEIYIKDHIDFDVPKIYFSGEYDSNQTKFERQSNQLEIGVLASNKSSGLIMLRLLRIIIDVRPDMLLEDALGLDNKNEQVALGSNLSIEKIMKNLSVCEKTYSNNYRLTSDITTNFVKEEYNFTRRLDHIDIWTLPRIMEHIRGLF